MPNRLSFLGGRADFVDRAHQSVFGTPADRRTHRHYDGVLAEHGRAGVVAAMLAEPAHAAHVSRGLGDGRSLGDEEFVRHLYLALLGRDADPVGLEAFLKDLSQGVGRDEVVRHLVRSEEYLQRAVCAYYPLVPLHDLRPDRYGRSGDSSVFRARGPEDFDWLESAIISGGYYDKPGVWGFAIDTDKRLMAEIVATFRPRTVLELGCASGPVLQVLAEQGVQAEGLEISEAAIGAAHPTVRERIHRVDVSSFELGKAYDVVFGLDIFEHLNPNRLGGCLESVERHLEPGGFVFANIPAFGHDQVFGEVFQLYIAEWWADHDAGRHFQTLHTDELGYPVNGHLIWAHTDWWVRRFEEIGLRRETGIERALHDRYDSHLAGATPARRSFYVFSKDADPGHAAAIEAAVRSEGSAVLAALAG